MCITLNGPTGICYTAPMDPRKTILVIEDEEGIRVSLRNALANEGYATLEAADGEAGLASALQNHPNLILLDLMLPKMDGLTLLERLRTDAWGVSVPVMITTNMNADDEVMKKVMKTEPAYYLVKQNWKLTDVVLKANEIIHGKKAES